MSDAERLSQLLLTDRVFYHAEDLACNRVGGLVDLIRHARPQSVCEVGCHRGVSTEAWLLHCSSVVAVDTWPDPQVFKTFLHLQTIYPHLWVCRMPSVEAAKWCGREGQFDLVYIDADHSYESVRNDLAAWTPQSRRWMAGHDYCEVFPGVMRAVREAFGEPMTFADSSWLIDLKAIASPGTSQR